MRYATVLLTAIMSPLLGCCEDDNSVTCPADRDCTGITCGIDPVCNTLCDYCPAGSACDSATGDCRECTTSDDCGTTDICIEYRCESAWNRAYRITIVDAVLQEGLDQEGTLPDSFVVTTIDATEYQTDTQDNNLTPTWNEYFDVTLDSASTIAWTIYDWDVFNHDKLFWCAMAETQIDVDWLRHGSVTTHSDDGLSQVVFTFDPR